MNPNPQPRNSNSWSKISAIVTSWSEAQYLAQAFYGPLIPMKKYGINEKSNSDTRWGLKIGGKS